MSVHANNRVYCCGTCTHWRRSVGCTMPATPATVNCGRTRFDQLCEQWWQSRMYWQASKRWRVRRRPTALDLFRDKISTPEQRYIRASHYLDGAVYGADNR